MVGLGLSLGIGLGMRTGGSPSKPPLCDAIDRQLCVTATDGGTVLTLAPHVVYKRGRREVVTLDAVLLARNGSPVNNPRMRTYPVDDLSEIAVTDEGFTVDPDFDPDEAAYAGRSVCIIQPV